MPKRVFCDKQIIDYDSDDPSSVFQRPKKRKKIRHDHKEERKNEHVRPIVQEGFQISVNQISVLLATANYRAILV